MSEKKKALSKTPLRGCVTVSKNTYEGYTLGNAVVRKANEIGLEGKAVIEIQSNRDHGVVFLHWEIQPELFSKK